MAHIQQLPDTSGKMRQWMQSPDVLEMDMYGWACPRARHRHCERQMSTTMQMLVLLAQLYFLTCFVVLYNIG
jgi:hypothetical protein